MCKTATLKKTKIDFQDQLLLDAGQKYCRMLNVEHSAILSTFMKLPIAIKIFVLSTFELPFYAGFTVCILKQKKTSDFHSTVSFGPIKMLQQK